MQQRYENVCQPVVQILSTESNLSQQSEITAASSVNLIRWTELDIGSCIDYNKTKIKRKTSIGIAVLDMLSWSF